MALVDDRQGMPLGELARDDVVERPNGHPGRSPHVRRCRLCHDRPIACPPRTCNQKHRKSMQINRKSIGISCISAAPPPVTGLGRIYTVIPMFSYWSLMASWAFACANTVWLTRPCGARRAGRAARGGPPGRPDDAKEEATERWTRRPSRRTNRAGERARRGLADDGHAARMAAGAISGCRKSG